MSSSRPTRQFTQRDLLRTRAYEMRWARATPSEQRLWAALRCRQLGYVLRRQVPVAGKYIADFLAPQVRLVVEVDGSCHARRQAADARRDAALGRLGYRVLRLPAELVTRDLPAAVALVREALNKP